MSRRSSIESLPFANSPTRDDAFSLLQSASNKFAAGATDFALQEISAWPTRFRNTKPKKISSG